MSKRARRNDVFAPGKSAETCSLLDGTVRVQQKSDTAGKVFFYRVNALKLRSDDSLCSARVRGYPPTASPRRTCAPWPFPGATFDELAARSPVFRNFIFKAHSRRITDLFTLIDDIVFQRMDVRLAARLLELAGEGDVVHATHQVLANELGTAREVISRTLSEFHRRGWVEQSRGEVRLRGGVGPSGLERLARSAGEKVTMFTDVVRVAMQGSSYPIPHSIWRRP